MPINTYDEEKFRNVVLYILKHSPTPPGVTQLLKMLYFSDKEHYRSHLSLISGAEYVAIERGPVIDNYRQIFRDLVQAGVLEERQVSSGYSQPKTEYVPLRQPNETMLTSSERAVLDAVIAECGKASGAALSEKSHQEGPWAYAWDPTSPGRPIPPILFRWLDNWPDDDDVARAQVELDRPEVVQVVAIL